MAITMKPIKQSRITFTIRGTSPIVQHNWSEKAKAMMRMTAAERKKQPKVPRDPDAEAEASCYYTDDGEHGIPLTAFKAALIGAAHRDQGLEKTVLRKAFFIPCTDSKGVVPMKIDGPYLQREDMVRIGQGSTDLRYRPQFNNWSVDIEAQIDAEMLRPKDIVNLVNRAGFSVGIGEWRPERGGEFGRFELDTSIAMTETAL